MFMVATPLDTERCKNTLLWGLIFSLPNTCLYMVSVSRKTNAKTTWKCIDLFIWARTQIGSI